MGYPVFLEKEYFIAEITVLLNFIYSQCQLELKFCELFCGS